MAPDKVLLVTGASRGIGAATARLAAQGGWAVAVNYAANSLAADEVVRAIRAGGGTAISVQADVADEAQVLKMFAHVDSKLGRLTGLVNNAGVVDRAQPVAEQSVARWRRMFDINVIGSMICAREAVRRMGTAHGGAGGSIVNLSSAAARLGSPNEYVDYAAAKAAIDAFTIGLAKEVAPQGIRQRRAAGSDRDRDPRQRRPAEPRRRTESRRAHGPRRHGGRSRAVDRLAAVGCGKLHHHVLD